MIGSNDKILSLEAFFKGNDLQPDTDFFVACFEYPKSTLFRSMGCELD